MRYFADIDLVDGNKVKGFFMTDNPNLTPTPEPGIQEYFETDEETMNQINESSNWYILENDKLTDSGEPKEESA